MDKKRTLIFPKVRMRRKEEGSGHTTEMVVLQRYHTLNSNRLTGARV